MKIPLCELLARSFIKTARFSRFSSPRTNQSRCYIIFVRHVSRLLFTLQRFCLLLESQILKAKTSKIRQWFIALEEKRLMEPKQTEAIVLFRILSSHARNFYWLSSEQEIHLSRGAWEVHRTLYNLVISCCADCFFSASFRFLHFVRAAPTTKKSFVMFM